MNGKKLLFFTFIIFVFVLFGFNVVHADDTTYDGYCYQHVEHVGMTDKGYQINYDVYLRNGNRQGTIYLTEEMYNRKWVLFYFSGSLIYRTNYNEGNFSAFNLELSGSRGDYFTLLPSSLGVRDYIYDFDNNSWSDYSLRSFELIYNLEGIFDKKDCDVLYGNSVSWSTYHDWRYLKTPEMRVASDGFRLHLKDFHDNITGDEASLYTVDTLSGLGLFVYDFNNKQYLTENLDLLSASEVKMATDGTYYIDIPFSLLSYINKVNCDYLISVIPILDARVKSASLPSIFYDNVFKYNPVCYWRYQYHSDTGTGGLVSTDSEGNPLKPDEAQPEPDKTVEAFENLKNSIAEQNKKLEEQTEAIKENTETNKNIFQQIIDLPGKLISMFLDMLKSVFIPSDDFLSNYFNELYNWFCDRLGFLSYPLQLVINILNKILNINWAEPIIHIPDIPEPFTNNLLIHATTFNFNSLLTNDTLKNVHDIYLVLVDAVIIFALVNLAKNKFEEVTKS